MTEFRFPSIPVPKPGNSSRCAARGPGFGPRWRLLGPVPVVGVDAQRQAEALNSPSFLAGGERETLSGTVLIDLESMMAYVAEPSGPPRRSAAPTWLKPGVQGAQSNVGELEYRLPEYRLPGTHAHGSVMPGPGALVNTVMPSALVPKGCTIPVNQYTGGLLDPDTRTRVPDASLGTYPSRVFTRIGGDVGGSGAFIGAKHVITAAHVVWGCNPLCGMLGQNITVFFGSGMSRNAQYVLLPYAWWSKGWNAGINSDYALIIVQEAGGYSPGFIKLTHTGDNNVVFTTTYGYPTNGMWCRAAPVPDPTCAPWGPCANRLYTGSMTAYTIKPGYFSGSAQAQIGVSGGPNVATINGQRRVVGIVVSGTVQHPNSKRFGPESSAEINNWISWNPHS